MMKKRHIATLAAIVGCTIGLAAPAMAAIAAPTAAAKATAATTIPKGLLPMSASWLTPERGIVLGYPKQAANAKPYLITTSNGGRTWQSLAAPPVPYPVDQDQPAVTWEDGLIAADDGTHIYVTANEGRTWSAERLAGASGSSYVDKVAITHGRVFALVTTFSSATVYSGVAGKGVLRAVPGLSVSGSDAAYGDLSTQGALEIDLGADYATEHYWYSKDGVHFTAAQLPCPVTTSADLGGVRAGKVIALCDGSPSDIGLGQNDKQVFIAAKLGGAFAPSGPVTVTNNTEGFVTDSTTDMTFETTFALYVTLNAGKTWTAEIPQNNGATFADLWYPSFSTGYVVCNTVNNASQEVDTLYKTTDGGRAWRAVALP
jgi:photosystem II stability/assembly factor-like uncharacterized protein